MNTSFVRASAVVALALLSVATVAACRRSCCPPVTTTYAPPMSTTHVAGPQTFADQAARGQSIFGATCAKCHGAGGEGTADAPALVGPTALPGTPPATRQLRTMPFHTVGDVQRFVHANMPPKGPKLSDSDAWAVVAFALKANGVTPPAPLSASNGDTLPLGR
jgi:mono/diheme cytochrome c family protein